MKITVLGRPVGPIFVATCWRELLTELRARLGAAPHDDEGDDRLAGVFVLGADDRGLGHLRVVDEGRLDLGGGDAMTGDVHDVVDPTEQPEVAIVVDLAAVAGEVAALEAPPVGVAVALRVAVDAPQHRRPGPGEREVAAAPLDRLARVVDDLGRDARQREGGRTGLVVVAQAAARS